MAYSSLEWEMLAIGYGIGMVIGMVALRLLLWADRLSGSFRRRRSDSRPTGY